MQQQQNLSEGIHQLILSAVQGFTSAISIKFGIEYDEIIVLWGEKIPESTPSKAAAKKPAAAVVGKSPTKNTKESPAKPVAGKKAAAKPAPKVEEEESSSEEEDETPKPVKGSTAKPVAGKKAAAKTSPKKEEEPLSEEDDDEPPKPVKGSTAKPVAGKKAAAKPAPKVEEEESSSEEEDVEPPARLIRGSAKPAAGKKAAGKVAAPPTRSFSEKDMRKPAAPAPPKGCPYIKTKGPGEGTQCGGKPKTADTEYCSAHIQYEGKDPKNKRTLPKAKASITAVPTRKPGQKTTEAILKTNKDIGKLWHEKTKMVFKGPTNRLVIGKCVDGKVVPLTSEDVDLCNEHDFKVDESAVAKPSAITSAARKITQVAGKKETPAQLSKNIKSQTSKVLTGETSDNEEEGDADDGDEEDLEDILKKVQVNGDEEDGEEAEADADEEAEDDGEEADDEEGEDE